MPERELRRSADFVGSDTVPLKWKGTSRLDWTWDGFSTGITAYYIDGFHETGHLPPTFVLRHHYVSQTWLFDVRASYTFNFVPTVVPPATVGGKETVSPSTGDPTVYACAGWRQFLNGTTLTLGCNNVFGQDPPHVFNFVPQHYPIFL